MNMMTFNDRELDRLLQRTKGQLFFSKTCSGLLGSLLCKVAFEWSTEFPTAAISPKKLYWNPDFFLSLDEQTRVTVLAHELYHNARMHSLRRGNRCPDIWNIAGDHVINIDLHDNGFYMGGFPYVMDFKYRGWSTEDVYDDLIAPGKPQPQRGADPLGGDVMDFNGTEEDKADAIADVISATASARMSNQPGSIPGETSLVLEKFLNPVLPWWTLLFNFFNELTNQEYSYAKPNRRYEDPLLRGLTGRNGLDHLIYYVDVSGSVSDQDILRMNSEVKFIWDELEPQRLTLVTFDKKIRDIYEFEDEDEFEKIQVKGRGGTDLEEVFKHMREQAPSAAVIFTDLYVGIPENPQVPIVWAVYNNPDAQVPFGRLVHVPPEKDA